MCLAWVVEHGGSSKINQLDNIVGGHDTVVEFEVTVSKAHFVEILYAVTDLAENAVNFWTTHLPAHNDAKKVERGILHDLEMIRESAGR